jgi:hypothetical protein
MFAFSTLSGVLVFDPLEHPAASIMIAAIDATPTVQNFVISPADFA